VPTTKHVLVSASARPRLIKGHMRRSRVGGFRPQLS
jgi:hypothetical protein